MGISKKKDRGFCSKQIIQGFEVLSKLLFLVTSGQCDLEDVV